MKFDYILLYVSDLEKTSDFYEKLGFEIVKSTAKK
ncbi:MAG: VOC family protein [Candidatus Pacebacteria bacterium]|nr:VOC family protein [Candidatus Paceibacterota bacterium]